MSINCVRMKKTVRWIFGGRMVAGLLRFRIENHLNMEKNDESKNRPIKSLALFIAGAAAGFAQSPAMGTWKLNEAKSKIPGAGRNMTVVYAADGDNTKVNMDGTSSDGKATHSEWVGKFDGKDYPVSVDSASDTRSYQQINDRRLTAVLKKSGKVTQTARIVVSADGMSRTVSVTGTDSAGKKVSSVAVYDKQ